MQAKAPLDVDLEDKLLYGLTPIRLAYLVVALLAGFAVWSSPWAPSPVRSAVALTAVVVGVAGAWGRWRGRAVDEWVADIAIFAVNTHRVSWNSGWVKRLSRRPARVRSGPRPEKVNGPVLLLSVAAMEAGQVRPERVAAGGS